MAYIVKRIVNKINNPDPTKAFHECPARLFKSVSLDEHLNAGPRIASNKLITDLRATA